MLSDIVTILAEEPEKAEKAVIRAVKLVFNIIIAAWLYKIVIGPFNILRPDEYKEWGEFFLSGRILICLLFYFITSYFLLPVIYNVSAGIIRMFAKQRFFSPEDKNIIQALKSFSVIKTNKNEVPYPGKNIELYVKVTKLFEDRESIEEIRMLRNTLIENTWNLYLLFTLAYFFISPKNIHTPTLTAIVVILLIALLIVYVAIYNFIDYMIENNAKIMASVSFIKSYHLTFDILKSYGIIPQYADKESGLSKFKVFYCKEKEYVLVFTVHHTVIRLNELRKLLTMKKNPGRVFIIIAPKSMIEDTYILLLENHDNLITIEFDNDEHLEKQLKQTIETITQ